MKKTQKEGIRKRIELIFEEYKEYIYKEMGTACDINHAFGTAFMKETKLLEEWFNDADYSEGDEFEPAYRSRAIYDAMDNAFHSIDKMKYASYVLKKYGGTVRKWYAAEHGRLVADMAFLKDRLAEMKKAN